MTFAEALFATLAGACVGAAVGALLGYLGGMKLARDQAEKRQGERRAALLSALRVELGKLVTTSGAFEPNTQQFVVTIRSHAPDAPGRECGARQLVMSSDGDQDALMEGLLEDGTSGT